MKFVLIPTFFCFTFLFTCSLEAQTKISTIYARSYSLAAVKAQYRHRGYSIYNVRKVAPRNSKSQSYQVFLKKPKHDYYRNRSRR